MGNFQEAIYPFPWKPYSWIVFCFVFECKKICFEIAWLIFCIFLYLQAFALKNSKTIISKKNQFNFFILE